VEVRVSAKRLTVIDRASPIPADLQPLFDDPPVLSTENSSQYRSLLDQIAKCVKPKDVIEWLWVRDIVDLSWEIQRLRRFKALFIERARQNISDCAEDGGGPIRPILVIRSSALDPPIEKQIEEQTKTKRRKAKFTESDSAGGFQACISDYQCVDRLLAAAEVRRNEALHEIELRRDSLARRLRRATDEIIDAEFNEARFAAE
jgi:hypothetical protein